MAKYFAIFLVALLGAEMCTAQISFPGKSTPAQGAAKVSGVGASVGASKVSAAAGGGEKAAAEDSKDPQARFFPGFGGVSGGGIGGFGGSGIGGFGGSGIGGFSGSGIGGVGGGGPHSIFNPCSRCNFRDVRQANECCMKGEIQCCRFVTGSGFGSNFGRPSAFRPGFSGQSFGSTGFPQGQGFGSTGFGSAQGFVPGTPGFVPGSQGFVPGTHGFVPGSQGFVPGSQGFVPGSSGAFSGASTFGQGGRPFVGRPHSNQKIGFCPKPNFIAEALGLRKVDDKKSGSKPAVRTAEAADKPKVKRQAQSAKAKESDPKGPQTRGLGNPFCRDDCFTDFDCPGNLKCCINSQECRFCTNPVLF